MSTVYTVSHCFSERFHYVSELLFIFETLEGAIKYVHEELKGKKCNPNPIVNERNHTLSYKYDNDTYAFTIQRVEVKP